MRFATLTRHVCPAVFAVAFLISPVEAQFAQQGSKLVGNNPIPAGAAVAQGTAVSLSADGNTAVIGAPFDNGDIGAAWVFTRSGGVWTQTQKLTPSDPIGYPRFGTSVAISADGGTIIAGGPQDYSVPGASGT